MLANKLLDYFGYKKGADGYRTLPDGKPLVLRLATRSTAIDREFNELWKKSMDAIGIRMEFDISKFADNLKAAKACQLMMWGAAWIADYPDGDNFMQLLYGPNTGQSNNGCYESKAFDALYVKSRAMPPDSPERNLLFLEMTRQMEVDGAWSLHVSRERNQMHPAVGEGLQEAPDPARRVRATWTSSRAADAAVDCPMRICRTASLRVAALALLRRRVARRARAADMSKVIRHVFPGGRDGLRSRAARRTSIPARSSRRSSRRCSPTTTSRGRRSSCR